MRSTPLLLTEKVASYTQYRTSKVMYMNEEIYPTANTFSARLNLALKFNVTSRFGSENYQVMNYGLGGTIISHLDSTGKLLYIRGFAKFGIKVAVSAKLRQLAGQTQENFNFGPSLPKF